MKITVVICTWNRAQLLDQTLSAMASLSIPPDVEWELLVVNNNCSDQTDEVIARHASGLPIRRLHEPRAGLSHARNCGVEAACGELIVWTDDDVLVDPDWLAAYARAARDWPGASFFGGTIIPWYEEEPPRWIEPHSELFSGMIVARDCGDCEGPLKEGWYPFGANMAFRRAALARRKFDPALGVSGQERLLGEDLRLIDELKSEGCTGVWVPGARVRHFVPKSRMTTAYLWKYFFGLGRTEVRMDGTPVSTTFFGTPRWLYRRLFHRSMRYVLSTASGRLDWAKDLAEVAHTCGMLHESRAALRAGAARAAREQRDVSVPVSS